MSNQIAAAPSSGLTSFSLNGQIREKAPLDSAMVSSADARGDTADKIINVINDQCPTMK